jgi:hypothetical protein
MGMKCDELKAEQWLDYSGEPMPCYPKAKVDAAIEELKAAHHKERHEYIEMVAQLKQKLEDAQASAYAESVDAGMRERKLKRALYKACANWADVMAFEETEGIGYDNSVAERWRKMESKCLKKSKEYL